MKFSNQEPLQKDVFLPILKCVFFFLDLFPHAITTRNTQQPLLPLCIKSKKTTLKSMPISLKFILSVSNKPCASASD
uniref:Uncharacterized protein n=1 Tax=Klebsiella pneumoniae TaxID=573 RepID=A0A8B0SYF2_KLEPN|nr:hypothetical protein [Klebsiella pneumoniae]